MIQPLDLDPNRHPHQAQFSRNGKTYRITWERVNLVNLFLVTGECLQPLGAYDCTVQAEGDSIASQIFHTVRIYMSEPLQPQPSPDLANLKTRIENCLTVATDLKDLHGSRELSLTITKLEEGMMWLEKAISNPNR
jgi:hypothetical protein